MSEWISLLVACGVIASAAVAYGLLVLADWLDRRRDAGGRHDG